MSWLSKLMPSGIRTDNTPSKKRSVPEGLWEKCSNCGSALYRPELEENLEVCPKCGKRVKPSSDLFACAEHGNVMPAYSYVLNTVLDDGTETIRCVFFRQQVGDLFN